LIAQLKISSRLIGEVSVARGPQDYSWWSRGSVWSIAASAEFSSTPTVGNVVCPRLWAVPTVVGVVVVTRGKGLVVVWWCCWRCNGYCQSYRRWYWGDWNTEGVIVWDDWG
jgi:hypothetical protein